MKLLLNGLIKFICGLLLCGLLIFLPAGTLRYFGGWLFMGAVFIPILLMVYSQSGMLVEAEGMAQAGAILSANGWTALTAVCTILFSLNHFPCATTLLTIRKETGSWFWTAVSFLLPTAVGVFLCVTVNLLVCLVQLIF